MVARSFQAVDVEICPICGRTGDYEGLRGNLVELVHDPLGLELLMNGTIRNQVVRFEDDQRDVAGITAVRDRLAVQQQVFPAMTGDREHVADWRDRAERSALTTRASRDRDKDDIDSAWRSAVTLTQLFLAELEREAPRTRRALEQVPLDRDDWKPHPKSMPLGRLAGLVASMPSWINLIIEQDELNLTPPPGEGSYQQPPTEALVAVHDANVQKGRDTLSRTTDEFLMTTNWRLLAGGQVVLNQPRHVVLRDTLNHLAHHRGQLTVYLRLVGRTVPAIYGPSADDQQFA